MRLALLLALLASCTGVVHEWHPEVPTTLPVAIVFAPDFGEELSEPVRRAAAYWNAMAGRTIFLDGQYAESTDSASVAYVRFEWGNPDDPNHPGRYELAVTTPENVVTFYSGFLSQSDADRESTARHELGHVIGLDHATLKECLMYPVIQNSPWPQPLCQEERTLLKLLIRRNFGK